MADASTNTFFADVPNFTAFEGVTDTANYRPLPDDWALVTGDIVNSTGAIAAGNYKQVNMSGASIISAVLNALDHADLPFVFGGDGALVAIPPSGIDKARAEVAAVRTWVTEEMGLGMRAAIVPLKDIRAAGFDVMVARLRVSEFAAFAMFAGGGAAWAESQMKQGRYLVEPAPPGARPDLTGLSCRWAPIPSRHGEIVSIIAVPGEKSDQTAFSALIADLVTIVAMQDRGGHPVPQDGPPQAKLTSKALDWEARASSPKDRRFKQKAWILFQYHLGQFLDRFNIKLGDFEPKRYKRDVAANSDFRKFDDGLKLTVDCSLETADQIEHDLAAAHAQGICVYGIHRQNQALMTCLVPSPMRDDHVHFVDGAAGGYASAAIMLKAQMEAVGSRQ